jgi:prepilin-type N-terminal cleavage/methylation domain-containing protein
MNRNALPRTQSGFTLVEIAIVLVIIGLLLGGILKGQEMITQARIKNIINDFNGITAAYFSYQDRYKAVPGDDRSSVDRWPVANFPGMVAGNGDGSLGGLYSDPPGAVLGAGAANESLKFWFHLRAAGFVAGPTAGPPAFTQPTNSVGGIVGVQNGAFGLLNGLVICTGNVTDKIAGAVDTQIDDQRPNAGQVVAAVQNNASNQETALAGNPAGTAAAAYIETGTTQLVMCKTI